MGEINSVSRPRRNPSLPFGGLSKILYIAAVSILATVGFQSVASAQSTDCSGAAEQLQAERPNVPDGTIERNLRFVPDVGGCVAFEGTTLLDSLSLPVYDPDTGAELGAIRDLDPDLTSGEFFVTYEEFCGAFFSPTLTAQDYYDQDANDKERAILDPDSDGLACTDEDDAFLSGDGEGASGEENPCADTMGYFVYLPTVDGCLLLEGSWPVVGVINSPVYDAETWRELGEEETIGAFKELVDVDDMYEYVGFDLTHEEFCTAFPTPDFAGPAEIASLTAEEYHDQLANDNEKAILDPDSDGLACTDDDEALLSGDVGEPSMPDEPRLEFSQTWNGAVTQTAEDGTESEFWVEANIIPISEMTDDLIGEVVGEARLVGLDCGGAWVLEEVNVDYVVVEERITDGTVENCVESVPITLTPRDDGALEYFYLDMNGSVGECVLTRRGGGVPEGGGEDTRKPSERMRVLGMRELPDTGGSILSPLFGGLFFSIGILGVAAVSRRA